MPSCLAQGLPSGSLPHFQERRSNLRFDITLPVLLHVAGEPWTVGETLNLSASGVFFVTSRPLLVGITAEYVLNFPPQLTSTRQPTHVRFLGKVMRIERIANSGKAFRIAVRNEGLSPCGAEW